MPLDDDLLLLREVRRLGREVCQLAVVRQLAGEVLWLQENIRNADKKVCLLLPEKYSSGGTDNWLCGCVLLRQICDD
jgi:hypothetical protein